MKLKNYIYKFVAVLLALGVWQAAACYINLEFILPTPKAVVLKLWELMSGDGFVSTLSFTFTKIISGFLLGFFIGIALALAAGKFKVIEHLLWPYMVTIKSIPVASFVIVALVWIESQNLSVLISFLMVLPITYTNILQGYKAIDKKQVQMADVFCIKGFKRFLYITLPEIKPFILSACSVAFGLAWKSGVAAELIGITDGSLGDALYYTKVNYLTTDLFAWTLVIILISIVFEKLFLLMLKMTFAGVEKL